MYKLNSSGVKITSVFIGLLTLLVAHGDFSQATIGPKMAKEFPVPAAGRSYFWGNSFGPVEHYLKKDGWKAFDRRNSLKEGEYLLLPRFMNAHAPISSLKNAPIKLVRAMFYKQKNPLRTFSLLSSAGWYSASWGVLPYSFSTNHVEEYYLFKYAEKRN